MDLTKDQSAILMAAARSVAEPDRDAFFSAVAVALRELSEIDDAALRRAIRVVRGVKQGDMKLSDRAG